MRARKTIQERFWPKVKISESGKCWEWQASRLRSGYGMIGSGGRGRPLLAHRVAWEIANGAIPEGMVVCHKCDNPACCNPAHLFVGAQSDNVRDMISKGRDCRGEAMSVAVKGRIPSGLTHRLAKPVYVDGRETCAAELAREFGVRGSSVRRRLKKLADKDGQFTKSDFLFRRNIRRADERAVFEGRIK